MGVTRSTAGRFLSRPIEPARPPGFPDEPLRRCQFTGRSRWPEIGDHPTDPARKRRAPEMPTNVTLRPSRRPVTSGRQPFGACGRRELTDASAPLGAAVPRRRNVRLATAPTLLDSCWRRRRPAPVLSVRDRLHVTAAPGSPERRCSRPPATAQSSFIGTLLADAPTGTARWPPKRRRQVICD